MHPHSPLAVSLLESLRREEELLRAALTTAADVQAALHRGDLPAALDSSTKQWLAAELHAAGEARFASASALAHALGLNAESSTLASLAAKLDGPHAAELLAARDRLKVIAGELAGIQDRNANLVAHLRSFFRGVLSDLATPDAPVRYGPSGSKLGTLSGLSAKASG